jgi:hypothetical protein
LSPAGYVSESTSKATGNNDEQTDGGAEGAREDWLTDRCHCNDAAILPAVNSA